MSLECGRSYTGSVNDCIHALDGIIKNTRGSEIGDDEKLKTIRILWSAGKHLVGLGWRPGSPTDLDPTPEKLIDDVGTNEARCSRDKHR